ncbi:MAG: dTDP-4-dehydrorhamnose reductase [Saprospiraceae bacterium]|nr:dTDP-4-dehydrorhamnose reductase [Saprospiraceae bacterium]
MILITGANGQLGECFRQASVQWPALKFVFAGPQDFDISNRAAVRAYFDSSQAEKFKWVINCAAYTAVDKAESEPDKAQKINVLGAKYLAEACAIRDIPFVHFSTDYVYHNRQNTPFLETDPVSPKGVYARTKLAGERVAFRVQPLTMVIRTSWVYSAFGQNFVKAMLRLGRERAELNVVADQIGSPTYAPDLAEAVLNIIQKVETGEVSKESIAGIWHYSNEGVASWYDFAAAIFELENIPCHVRPIATRDYPTPAQRPPFSVLDKHKIKAAFGLEIPHWRESLRRCLANLS